MTPTTELEAVNTLLGYIQEAPVTSLDAASVDAQAARSTLLECSRDLQADGWHWNTATALLLRREANGRRIFVPSNALTVRFSDKTLMVRAGRVFKTTDMTDTHDADITVECVFLLPFTEIPEQARSYIVLTAAQKFVRRIHGDQQEAQALLRDIARARADLINAEAEWAGYNVLGNESISRVFARRAR